MRDRDVRAALFAKVLGDHLGQPDTIVLNELGLRHGVCRVDVAVVNGFLHGFEIKSDADTLERLPRQVGIYSAVLDRATLVVSHRHVSQASAMIPDWWGIKVAITGPRGAIDFDTKRPFKINPSIDPVAVAELLWRTEAIKILAELGADSVQLRRPRAQLYRIIAAELELNTLRRVVRDCLKSRVIWRGHRPRASSGDS